MELPRCPSVSFRRLFGFFVFENKEANVGYPSTFEDIEERRSSALGLESVRSDGITRSHKPVRYRPMSWKPTLKSITKTSEQPKRTTGRFGMSFQKENRIDKNRLEKFEKAIKDARRYAGYLRWIISRKNIQVRRLKTELDHLHSENELLKSKVYGQ